MLPLYTFHMISNWLALYESEINMGNEMYLLCSYHIST